jgi:hypothetical protein
MAEVEGPGGASVPATPISAWRVLKQLDGGSGDVELARVKRTIQKGPVPEFVVVEAEDRIVVSTIHRAKGLEFMTVVLVKPEQSDDAMETRVLYVGLTRASDQIYALAAPRMRLRLDNSSGHRWTTVVYPGPRPIAIELRPKDADHAVPPGGSSASDIQSHLLNDTHPGDPLYAWLREDGRYSVTHKGVTVADLTETFSKDVRSAIRTKGRTEALPAKIEGLFVESVVTVAGDPTEGEAAGLGRTGLWLGLRMHGLGRFAS